MIFDEIAARKLGLFPDRDCFVYLSPHSWIEREDPGSEIRITKEGTPISFKVFIRLIFFFAIQSISSSSFASQWNIVELHMEENRSGTIRDLFFLYVDWNRNSNLYVNSQLLLLFAGYEN